MSQPDLAELQKCWNFNQINSYNSCYSRLPSQSNCCLRAVICSCLDIRDNACHSDDRCINMSPGRANGVRDPASSPRRVARHKDRVPGFEAVVWSPCGTRFCWVTREVAISMELIDSGDLSMCTGNLNTNTLKCIIR